MRLTDHDVERLCGCTPCLCGDIETWHSRCYVGKTKEQIAAGYKLAFAKARKKIRQKYSLQASHLTATIGKRTA